MGSRIIVDPEGWLPGTSVPWLAEARQAVMDKKTLGFRYQSGSHVGSKRVITPALGLLCAANTWYLVSVQGASARFFRLDRIGDLKTSKRARPFPTDVDVEASWRAARARFRERFVPMTATLSLTAQALAQLRGLCTIGSPSEGSCPD
jgi:predicted DNA-binding transcriptional regulator YafY